MRTDTISVLPAWPAWQLFLARVVSVVFHPVFVGVGMMYLVTYGDGDLFLGVGERSKLYKFITFANNNLLFPLLIVGLLRGLGFTRSVRMASARERIVPYIAVITFQFWTWHVFRNQPDTPAVLTAMCLGMFLSTSLALVINNFLKASMHAMGMGGLTGLMLSLVFLGHASEGAGVVIAILLTGVVCTSRMLLGAHDAREMVAGLLTGLVPQLWAQLS